MEGVIFLLLSAFSSILRGVEARAVDTNITFLLPSNATLSILLDSGNSTISSRRCIDIDTCRTLSDIVQSCVLTILACVWFAVHRNIPAPKVKSPKRRSFLFRLAHTLGRKILHQKKAVLVFIVTLIAPEWILAWALRQMFTARKLVGELEQASLEAKAMQQKRCAANSDSSNSPQEASGSPLGYLSSEKSVTTPDYFEKALQVHHPAFSSIVCARCEKYDRIGSHCDRYAAEILVGKTKEHWTMTHAFFVIMGGFLFHDEKGPLHPLSPKNVVELVRRGHLVPPTAEEISNQSKGDALSKGAAIVQTLWFVMQCITRRAESLPVTNLEVMTLAYTVMTVAMYIVWWHKPLNVSCAVRVAVEDVEVEKADVYRSIWELVFNYVIGWQDDYVDLRQRKRVPTFWAGRFDDVRIAVFIALLVAMAFGAVHCIAWSSEFQSHLEQQLWRYSAIAIIIVPVTLPLVFLFVLIGVALCMDTPSIAVLNGVVYTPIAILYIIARLVLIILSFKSLSHLPLEAYQTPQWTTFIPHI